MGLAFLGLILLTLVGCVNYGLSLGYGLTFLLSGLWIITAAQVTRGVRLLTLTVLPPPAAVVGQEAVFSAQVTQNGAPGNVMVRAQAQQAGVTKAVQAGGIARPGTLLTLPLQVPDPVRGPLVLQNAELVAVDVLGLWQASLPAPVAAAMPAEVLVYPRPEISPPPPPTTTAPGQDETARRVAGHDDFAGLRPYQAGDSPRHISWRHAARTGQLLSREYDAPAGVALRLDWAATSGETEARLSRLAAWVEQARRSGQAFTLALPGITLPGVTLASGSGERQASAALQALARFAPLPTPAAPTLPARSQNLPVALPLTPLRFSLLALGVSLLPGLLHWPLWISGLCLGLLVYAGLQADPRRKLPALPAAALLVLAVAVSAGLWVQFGSLVGLDAGTAILAALLCLKAAETRTVRDARLLSLLGIFMLITHFFGDQGPLTALHSVLALGLLLVAAAGWVIPASPGGSPGGSRAGRAYVGQATRLLLLAAPLALALFFLFPRPDGPLWRLPFQGGNQTGLADDISAGSFSNLAQSSAVAFRADFDGALPPPAERYWRGPVYEAYDGNRWTQVRYRFTPPSIETLSSTPLYHYSLTLEPNGRPWLLALDTPARGGLPANAILTSAFQAATLRPATLRTRYDLQSAAALLGRQEDADRLRFDLQLPAGQNPRALALAQSWRTLAPEQRIRAALDYISRGGFSYTLNPPVLSEQNRIDDFLFRSRQGFCEHYSSAFAFLMRAAGIPTRIVGGYQGGQVGLDGKYLTIRQQDAHAWNEVWLQGQGWVRVDPTAAVAPARVSANLGTALTQPSASRPRPLTSLDRLRLRYDAFQNQWNTWVSAYDGEQQRSVLARLGLSRLGLGSPAYMLALAALVGLVLLPIFVLVRRGLRPRDPGQAALYDLSERLKLPRQSGETATAYASRAAGQYPAQGPLLHEIAALFNQWRYSPDTGSNTDAAQHLARLRALVRQVRRR